MNRESKSAYAGRYVTSALGHGSEGELTLSQVPVLTLGACCCSTRLHGPEGGLP
jgi:hypothetical protein